MAKKYDLHSHSIFSSDSITGVEKLVERYARLGFAGFALTDHHSIDGWKRAQAHIRAKKLSLEFIPACEFETVRGDLIGLYLSDMIHSHDPLELIDRIHSQGGLAILPHPFDSIRGRSAMSPERLGKEGSAKLDGIEVFNARCARSSSNDQALAFATPHALAHSGGSDAHFLFEAGNGFTLVPDPLELAAALRKRKTLAGGQLSPIFVHGPTTLVKLGKKAKLLPRADKEKTR